jgi:hypothetical protein
LKKEKKNMGDRTTVDIDITTYAYKNILKNHFKNDVKLFEEAFCVSQIDADIKALTRLTQEECNYAEWESLQKFLAENKIEYNKYWGAGGEYAAGEAYCRLIDGQMRLLEYYETDKSLVNFVETLMKMKDPKEIQDAVKAEYKRQTPFEIKPLDRASSVDAILELDKTKKKRKK